MMKIGRASFFAGAAIFLLGLTGCPSTSPPPPGFAISVFTKPLNPGFFELHVNGTNFTPGGSVTESAQPALRPNTWRQRDSELCKHSQSTRQHTRLGPIPSCAVGRHDHVCRGNALHQQRSTRRKRKRFCKYERPRQRQFCLGQHTRDPLGVSAIRKLYSQRSPCDLRAD
jgi:hypothetical protein